MKNILFTLSLLLYCSYAFCENTNDSISKVVSFEYDSKMERTIILEAKINDSIRSRMILDTGWSGLFVPQRFLAKDVVENMAKEEEGVNVSIKVSIANKWEYTYPKDWTAAFDSTHIFNTVYGEDISIADWKIFQDKIIEISFKDKTLRELEGSNIEAYLAQDYDSIKLKREDNVRLGIPVTICIQGREVTEYLLLDTGSNGAISFNSNVAPRNEIDLENPMYEGASRTGMGNVRSVSLPIDFLSIGRYRLENIETVAFYREGQRQAPFSGLLWTSVLMNYKIILDLKGFYIYIKPEVY